MTQPRPATARPAPAPEEAPPWEALPPEVARALIEEAERVWNGDGSELHFWRGTERAKFRRIPRGETRSIRAG